MKNKLTFLIVGLVALLTISFTTVQAQVDLKSVYSLTSDTVTNTGTVYLGTVRLEPAAATTTTIWVAVTKISGTVGGTITLQGSLDGTNYKALYAINSATALAAFTATDASNTYHWILTGSPMTYYRVSWTGTGTMSASFTAKIFRAR